MTLTFNTHISSYIKLDVCSYQRSGHWLQLFLKNPLFSLSPIEKTKLLKNDSSLFKSNSLVFRVHVLKSGVCKR